MAPKFHHLVKNEQTRQEKRNNKREREPRTLYYNINEVSTEDTFIKHLKLFPTFLSGSWRDQLHEINSIPTKENEGIVSI